MNTPTHAEQEALKQARQKLNDLSCVGKEFNDAKEFCNEFFRKHERWCMELSQREKGGRV